MTARWLLLSYKMPAEPSAPRVAVWRALQKLDGAYLHDGLFAMRAGDLALVTLRELAHDVRNLGGEANVLEVERTDDERHLNGRVAAATATDEKRASTGNARSAARSKSRPTS
jgi:hypothetical protein